MDKIIYLVGGAVRDALMGVSLNDKDYVAVGYTKEEFNHLECIGKSFPVFITEEGHELALARTECSIGNKYQEFLINTENVTLEEDLSRRDLTINSIAYNEKTGEYIDPFNGISDIKNKIIRHTSKAFCEDPLRILRVARFRSKYGYDWKIHPTTKVLIYKMRKSLKYIHPDRVWKEIDKVLGYQNTHIFFETLFELGVLDIIFPSIYALTTLKEGTVHHEESSVFVHTMEVLKLFRDRSKLLKLTAIYHDIGKPICYREHGNSAGHEDKDLVSSLIDISIPGCYKRPMLFIISKHVKVFKLMEMRTAKVAKFFESFRGDISLLHNLIDFCNADNSGRITRTPKKDVDRFFLINSLSEIKQYSPIKWISEQKVSPTGETIKNHIHQENIRIIRRNMKKNYFEVKKY